MIIIVIIIIIVADCSGSVMAYISGASRTHKPEAFIKSIYSYLSPCFKL